MKHTVVIGNARITMSDAQARTFINQFDAARESLAAYGTAVDARQARHIANRRAREATKWAILKTAQRQGR